MIMAFWELMRSLWELGALMWRDAKITTLQLWLRRPVRHSDPPITFSRSGISMKTVLQLTFVVALFAAWTVVMVFFLWPFFVLLALFTAYSIYRTFSAWIAPKIPVKGD
jgi:hypothetical protein